MQTFYEFRLTAANKKSDVDFISLKEIFTKAVENVNSGIAFVRERKRIIIDEITDSAISLTLYASEELPSPKRTLSAFSRELIRLDSMAEKSILKDLVYNHTLFRVELLETIKSSTNITVDSISNADLLKAVVDLLFSPTDYNTKAKNDTIISLKEIMLPYFK